MGCVLAAVGCEAGFYFYAAYNRCRLWPESERFKLAGTLEQRCGSAAISGSAPMNKSKGVVSLQVSPWEQSSSSSFIQPLGQDEIVPVSSLFPSSSCFHKPSFEPVETAWSFNIFYFSGNKCGDTLKLSRLVSVCSAQWSVIMILMRDLLCFHPDYYLWTFIWAPPSDFLTRRLVFKAADGKKENINPSCMTRSFHMPYNLYADCSRGLWSWDVCSQKDFK